MNYSELSTQIQNTCENDETTFVAEIPNFVKRAEKFILHQLRLPMFRKNSLGTLTSGNQYLTTPTDYLSPLSLAIVSGTDHVFLDFKDANYIRAAFPNESSTGTPRYYAVWDDDAFILGPTPNANYTAELHYFFLPTSIVDSSTSWLGDNAEHLLLYGCLVEAYIFMKGEADILGMYQERYNKALERMIAYSSARTRKDVYRGGELRIEATP